MERGSRRLILDTDIAFPLLRVYEGEKITRMYCSDAATFDQEMNDIILQVNFFSP